MKAYVDCDDRYPDWSISTDNLWGNDVEIELTDEEFAAIENAARPKRSTTR